MNDSDDMGTMPIPELVEGMRENARKAFDKGGMIDGLVLNVLANRLEAQHTENGRWKALCASMLVHIEPGAGQRRAENYEAEYNDLVDE